MQILRFKAQLSFVFSTLHWSWLWWTALDPWKQKLTNWSKFPNHNPQTWLFDHFVSWGISYDICGSEKQNCSFIFKLQSLYIIEKFGKI